MFKNNNNDNFVKYLKFWIFPFNLQFLFLGNHTIEISYDGLPVPGSPFKVNVMRGCDPRKVKAFGPGLEQAIVNQVSYPWNCISNNFSNVYFYF